MLGGGRLDFDLGKNLRSGFTYLTQINSQRQGADRTRTDQFMGYDNNQPVAVRVPLYQLRGFSFNGKLRLGQLPPLEDNEAIEVAMALGRVGQAADYRKLWPSPDLTSVMGYSPQRQIIEVTA